VCVCVFSLGGRITVNKYLFYDACVCALYRHAVVVVVVVLLHNNTSDSVP